MLACDESIWEKRRRQLHPEVYQKKRGNILSDFGGKKWRGMYAKNWWDDEKQETGKSRSATLASWPQRSFRLFCPIPPKFVFSSTISFARNIEIRGWEIHCSCPGKICTKLRLEKPHSLLGHKEPFASFAQFHSRLFIHHQFCQKYWNQRVRNTVKLPWKNTKIETGKYKLASSPRRSFRLVFPVSLVVAF